MGHVGKTVTQNVVSGSEITDGTVTGADLASDIAISTSGNISTTGDLTVDTNTLKVDSSNNRVGIGEASPSAPLHMDTGSTTDIMRFGADGRWGFQRANSDSRYLSLSRGMNSSASSVLEVDGDNGKVGIGTTPSDALHVYEPTGQRVARFEANNSTSAFIAFKASNTSLAPAIGVKDEALFLSVGDAVERARLSNNGEFGFNNTSSPADDDTTGIVLNADGNDGLLSVSRNTSDCAKFNRKGNDGTIIELMQAGNAEGTISVSGSSVSYNGFTGSHWSRLTDNSKPTILRGTVIETIDEMMDWYQVEFTKKHDGMKKYTKDDQEVKDGIKSIGDDKLEDTTVKRSIELPSGKSVGDTMTYTENGVDYVGTILKEHDIKHVKCKISDTADCTNVYGVFSSWDNDDDTVNDMYVNSLGTSVVRIHKDQTVAKGDLLTSNGDGTAKKQDDDIIRSKTIGKVLANIKQETYSDGSYTVPCALYCG